MLTYVSLISLVASAVSTCIPACLTSVNLIRQSRIISGALLKSQWDYVTVSYIDNFCISVEYAQNCIANCPDLSPLDFTLQTHVCKHQDALSFSLPCLKRTAQEIQSLCYSGCPSTQDYPIEYQRLSNTGLQMDSHCNDLKCTLDCSYDILSTQCPTSRTANRTKKIILGLYALTTTELLKNGDLTKEDWPASCEMLFGNGQKSLRLSSILPIFFGVLTILIT